MCKGHKLTEPIINGIESRLEKDWQQSDNSGEESNELATYMQAYLRIADNAFRVQQVKSQVSKPNLGLNETSRANADYGGMKDLNLTTGYLKLFLIMPEDTLYIRVRYNHQSLYLMQFARTKNNFTHKQSGTVYMEAFANFS